MSGKAIASHLYVIMEAPHGWAIEEIDYVLPFQCLRKGWGRVGGYWLVVNF